MNKSLIAMVVICSVQPLYAAEDNSSFDVLFEQAEFWQDKNRNDLAKDALQRVLNADPKNMEAMYRSALIASKEGNDVQLQQWISKMTQLAPTDPRIEELSATKAAAKVDPVTLAEARHLGSIGQYDAALERYREVFGGSTAPLELAAEYYLTMAGTANGLSQARAELKKLYQARPAHGAIKQAYAQVLSYDESSRREGISLLSELAPNSALAKRSWRQALLWLNASTADKKYYDQYLSVEPDDQELIKTYQDKIKKGAAAVVLNNRTRGYQALNANKLAEAKRQFQKALTENAADADALAGLGLIDLKQQNFSTAKEQLGRAMAMSPKKASSWRDAYQAADFYSTIGKARELMQAQQNEQALELVEPFTKVAVTKNNESRVNEARVLAGQLQHKLGLLELAAQSFNAVIQKSPANTEAKLGLIAVLQSMGRWEDAERLSAQLSESEQHKVAYVSLAEVQKLRADAAKSSDLLAEISLRRAMKLAPNDPWVRLDLARLLNKQSDPARARAIIEPLLSTSQPVESRYAAAMFAAEQKRWSDVERIMAGIRPEQRTAPMQSLAAQSALRGKFSAVLQRATAGDQVGARQLMLQLYQSSRMGSKAAGEFASELATAGQLELAYQLVELDLMQGLDEKSADYLAHVAVLNQSGRSKDARSLLSELMLHSDLSMDDRKSLASLQQGLAVREADQLREAGQLALAYDVLAAHLRESPDDESLLLAMGRLYQSGDKTSEADQIYNYVLKLNPASRDALSGAVDTALQLKQPDRAAALLNRIDWDNNVAPELLVLAAKVAEAKGEHDEAAALLLRARKLAYQDTPVWGGGTASGLSANPFRETAEPDANPFKDKRKAKKQQLSSARPSWLPGEVVTEAPGYADTTAQSATLFDQIDGMLADLEQKTLTRVDTDVLLKVRNGADGSSGLDTVETPVVISTAVFGTDRVELALTPTSLNSGTVTGEDINGYGRGSIVNAASGLSSRLDSLTDVLDSIEETAVAYDSAQAIYLAARNDPQGNLPESEIIRLQNVANAAKVLFDNAAQTDLFEALELNSANLTEDQQSLVQQFLQENYGDTAILLNSDSLADFQQSRARVEQLITSSQARLDQMAISTGNPDTQRESGVALALAYKGEWIAADVGTTPLGFEKTNVVGGVKLQPEIMKNTRLVVQAERRPVKDSLLAYAGTVDHVTGETWGAVTKTGAGLGLNFDNGKAGAYGSVAEHKYEGDNVASNDATSMEVGAYFRPFYSAPEMLQLGVHVGYSSFDNNLSKFTFGHGGYFSPQDYVSVAFPINYSAELEEMRFSLLFAPGFQSYSEDGNSFFPTDAAAQAALDLFYALGAFPQAGYAATSQSGFGMSFGASGEYLPDPYLKIGGQLGFDSFGDYNEMSFRLYMKYLIGASND